MSTPGRTLSGVERGAARRHAILIAARDQVAEYGVSGMRLNAVAEQAGVGRTGLLHHFPSKEALLHALLDEHEGTVAPLAGRVAAPGGLGSVLALVEIAKNDVRNRQWSALWNALLADAGRPDSVLRDRLVGTYEAYQANVRTFLTDAEAAGELRAGVDIRAETLLILAGISGLEASWLLDERVPLVELMQLHLDRTVERLRA